MKTKDLVYAALFAAFMTVLGFIPAIPLSFIPTPITIQTLGVMLAGCFLGRKMGALSMIIFLVLVAIGAPLLSGGRGDFAVLVGPTAGYLWSWPLAAYVAGYLVEKTWNKLKIWKVFLINVLAGVLIINLIGAPVMALITETSIWAGVVSSVVFLPGDLIKAIIASVILIQLKSVSPIQQKVAVQEDLQSIHS